MLPLKLYNNIYLKFKAEKWLLRLRIVFKSVFTGKFGPLTGKSRETNIGVLIWRVTRFFLNTWFSFKNARFLKSFHIFVSHFTPKAKCHKVEVDDSNFRGIILPIKSTWWQCQEVKVGESISRVCQIFKILRIKPLKRERIYPF